jgi:hypothetical protein
MRSAVAILAFSALAAPCGAQTTRQEPATMRPVVERFEIAFAESRPDALFKHCRRFKERTTDCHYDISAAKWMLGEFSILLDEGGNVNGVSYSGVWEPAGEREGSPLIQAIAALGPHSVDDARRIFDRLRRMAAEDREGRARATVDGTRFTLSLFGRLSVLFAVRERSDARAKAPT